jgi:hypothetical protein
MQSFKPNTVDFKNYIIFVQIKYIFNFCCNFKEIKFSIIFLLYLLYDLHIDLVFFKILDKIIIKV